MASFVQSIRPLQLFVDCYHSARSRQDLHRWFSRSCIVSSWSSMDVRIVVNISNIAALSILSIQIISNHTKHSFIIYILHTHNHPMFTLIHDSLTPPHRYDDRHRSERHLRISLITHAETRTRPRSRCVGCRHGSLPSIRSEQITIGVVLPSGTSLYPSGITHGESRSDAEHRIGIFPFLTTFPSF
jgi:hypothetical protein